MGFISSKCKKFGQWSSPITGTKRILSRHLKRNTWNSLQLWWSLNLQVQTATADFRKWLSQLIYFDVHYETLLGRNNTQIQDSFTSTGRVLKNEIRHVFEAKSFAVNFPVLHIFLQNPWPKEPPLNHFPSPPLICQLQLDFSCSTICPIPRG